MCFCPSRIRLSAAAVVCDAIAARFSRQAAAYKRKAVQLRQRGHIRMAIPVAGGITVADNQATENDAGLEKPAFKTGLHDEPGTLPSGSNPNGKPPFRRSGLRGRKDELVRTTPDGQERIARGRVYVFGKPGIKAETG